NHTLASAFPASAVWFYQEVARRVGEERMAEWVGRLGYGNGETSGGIDRFWLDGGLRISADEQVEFLRRLNRGELPVSERSARIVRDIMRMEETGTYTLRGKRSEERRVGKECRSGTATAGCKAVRGEQRA